MKISSFIEKIKQTPKAVEFQETILFIDAYFDFTPTAFYNGEIFNELGQNMGSCKVFAFAQLHNLNKSETLACFGAFYFNEVLGFLEGTSHQNIRNFMKFGWDGLQFKGIPLIPKIL